MASHWRFEKLWTKLCGIVGLVESQNVETSRIGRYSSSKRKLLQLLKKRVVQSFDAPAWIKVLSVDTDCKTVGAIVSLQHDWLQTIGKPGFVEAVKSCDHLSIRCWRANVQRLLRKGFTRPPVTAGDWVLVVASVLGF